VRGNGPATRSIKIRELLSPTAGFPGQAAIDAGQWRIKQDGTLADAVADLPQQGLATEPGTAYAYTGLGCVFTQLPTCFQHLRMVVAWIRRQGPIEALSVPPLIPPQMRESCIRAKHCRRSGKEKAPENQGLS
jgi:hypothetical protein